MRLGRWAPLRSLCDCSWAPCYLSLCRSQSLSCSVRRLSWSPCRLLLLPADLCCVQGRKVAYLYFPLTALLTAGVGGGAPLAPSGPPTSPLASQPSSPPGLQGNAQKQQLGRLGLPPKCRGPPLALVLWPAPSTLEGRSLSARGFHPDAGDPRMPESSMGKEPGSAPLSTWVLTTRLPPPSHQVRHAGGPWISR